MACRIRIHGAWGLAMGDIPPGTTRWYMGRTIRGGPARKIEACTARLQVILNTSDLRAPMRASDGRSSIWQME